MRESKFNPDFSDRLSQREIAKSSNIKQAAKMAGTLTGALALEACATNIPTNKQILSAKSLETVQQKQKISAQPLPLIPDRQHVLAQPLDADQQVLTARGEVITVVRRVEGGLSNQTNFKTANDSVPCEAESYSRFVQNNALYGKYLRDTGVRFASFERTQNFGSLVAETNQPLPMAYRKPNNEYGWTLAIPSDHTDLTNQLINRDESFGIVNQVLQTGAVRQALIRCTCGNPVEEEAKVPVLPTQPVATLFVPTSTLEIATLTPTPTRQIVYASPIPFVQAPTPLPYVFIPQPELIIPAPLPPVPPEFIPIPPQPGLPPRGHALIFKWQDGDGDFRFNNSPADNQLNPNHFEIRYGDPLNGLLGREVIKMGPGWAAGMEEFDCPPPGFTPLRYYVRELSVGVNGFQLIQEHNSGLICGDEHAEFWNQLILTPTPLLFLTPTPFIPTPLPTTVLPTAVTPFIPRMETPTPLVPVTPSNTPIIPVKTPDTPTPAGTNTTPLPTETPVLTVTLPKTKTPDIPTPAGTNTTPVEANTPGLTATLVKTRTPGGDTPTVAGTKSVTPVVVLTASPTEKVVPPTPAATNTAPVKTNTPGLAATLVPTRTPGAPSPTVIGTVRSLNTSPDNRPATPTAPKVNSNRMISAGELDLSAFNSTDNQILVSDTKMTNNTSSENFRGADIVTGLVALGITTALLAKRFRRSIK